MPHFDRHDPLGWIFKISQFFYYQGTPDEECITVASFYLDGPTLSWFQWMYRNNFITSWPTLLQAIETRFTPSFYDDPRGALFKLVQRGTFIDYLTEFERLANRIVGLSPPILLSFFIYGLNLEIRRKVQVFQPISVPQATALARLQEDKLNHRRKHSKPPFTTHQPSPLTLHRASHLVANNHSSKEHKKIWRLDEKRAYVTIVRKNGAPLIIVKAELYSLSPTPITLHNRS